MPVINNPKPHVIPEGENATPLEVVGATASDKLVIIMVGLPGTGKTHVSRRICRYISFFHDIPSQIFNVGEYRRQMLGAKLPASFYDHSNKEAVKRRKVACDQAMNDLIDYMLQDGVRLGIYDATNSTPEARKDVLTKLEKANVGAKKIFMEVICDEDRFLEENIKSVKTSTPDYENVEPEEAIKDFKERRKNYMDVYKTVEDHEGSYVKILNYHKFVMSNIRGYLPLKVSLSIILGNKMTIIQTHMRKLKRYIYIQPPTITPILGCPLHHELTYNAKDILPHPPRTIRVQPLRKNWR